jgi:tetratricopeptide (TPR) repeat protein
MKNIDSFKREIHSLLDESEYQIAKEKVEKKLANLDKDDKKNLPLLAEIAGFMIDIGSEALDKDSAENGIKILKDYEGQLQTIISVQSYNYCLANGIHALYKIETRGLGLPTLEMIKPHLVESKNYYYKAFKEINLSEIDNIDLQILTNLGNNLSQSGRITEAVRLYNSVLKFNSNFPQALIGLAEDLDYWLRISFCPRTISLYQKIYSLYKQGLNKKAMPLNKLEYYELQLKMYKTILDEHDFNFSSTDDELKQNYEEYKKHSSFRKFCIDNFLTLNEHSIYCSCTEAKVDDVSIVHEKINVYGDKVGKMELLLNRLKSEFSLARKLYYEGVNGDNNYTDTYYSELMDGELIGEDVEKIRTAFRLCFGVFDKIAHGICYFFDLPKKKMSSSILIVFGNLTNVLSVGKY